MNYLYLTHHLKKKNWREANEETSRLLLEVFSSEKQGYLRIEEVRIFPCEVLCILDRLWRDNSNRKFGISIQVEIYKSLGGKEEYNRQIWDNFFQKVGWMRNGNYIGIEYESINVDTLVGYLPNLAFTVADGNWNIGFNFWPGYYEILPRALNCDCLNCDLNSN